MSTQAELAPLLAPIVDLFVQRVKALWTDLEGQPECTLAEMEGRVQTLGREVLGPLLSALMAGRDAPAVEAGECGCGQPLQAKGRQSRSQETLVGTARWTRAYYYCPRCRQGHYPLDEQLQVAPGAFSERVQEGMAQVGASLPFAQAARVCGTLLGVEPSAKSMERVTERRGTQVGVARQAEEARALAGEALPGPQGQAAPAGREAPSPRWAVGLDGVKVHFRDGWHEVATGVVYQVGPEGRAEAQSYLARTGGLGAAGQGLYAEALRRGVDPAVERMGCLADGAPGNWRQLETHFPRRMEILDWFHALEHLWGVGRALYGEGSEATREWVRAREGELWAGRPEAVREALHEASGQTPGGEVAAQQVGYFTTNAERMRYARFRAEGWPIGSGPVEGACKSVVGVRLKGPGMSWSTAGAQAVLNLRAELLSNRWDQGWALSRPPKS
jgi:hypothetical protein